jgi:hypothetical protein
MGLAPKAKNEGWQIALISFVTFLDQARKVSSKTLQCFKWQNFNQRPNIRN